jgi:predicted DNA-binding transcriptional regulator AlpA
MMKIFEFTIIATGLDPHADDFESQFFDAGCDDATVSFQKGHILIDFGREAASQEDAVASAVADVRQTGAVVERVEPDPLVSLSEMATRSQMSRAAMTNYFKGNRNEGFPAPKVRVTSAKPLWDWSDISVWLYRQGRLSHDIAEEAAVFSVANDLLACSEANFGGVLHERVRERVAAF